MPSGKTHDKVTFLLAPFAFALTWRVADNAILAAVVTAAFLFGGLMCGPDLDTNSVEYQRWGVFRFLWWPYKLAFAHRSRWSHGLIFGTLIRVVYLAGVMTLVAAGVLYLSATLRHAAPPNMAQIEDLWRLVGDWTRHNIGAYALIAAFAGLWFGAAAHTLADWIGTYLKKG